MSHWSQERLHADVHKAVGGSLNLVRELSRISQELEPSVPSEWLLKRALFYSYELNILVDEGMSERDRLARLNHFFFEEKKFRGLTDPVHLGDPSDPFRLSTVFSARQGSPIVVAVLYGFLAERIGVPLEFVDFKPACFLKWVDSGHCRYIDVGRGGATLASDEVIELLHSQYQLTTVGLDQLLEPVSFEALLTTYLSQLKQAFAPRKEYEKTLFLQNALIAYQPSNLQLIAERAVLHRKLGHFKSALADLKRFFAFNDRDRAPAELVKLHDDLVTLLDRHRAGLDPGPGTA